MYVTEYGVADVRGRTDEDCIAAMTAITDARFQTALIAAATRGGKLPRDFALPAGTAGNTPAQLRSALAPLRRDGTLPEYPLGSDFTPVEQRLARALGWLKGRTADRSGRLRTVLRALPGGATNDHEAAERMSLQNPRGLREIVESRLLALALRETRG
ncbi:acetyl-CoA hydrolase/transferase C-terminal domain-containing protein [Rhodococcus sp. MTM3W5.2]|uniref:acetyl-CoA hydrolase/transferase C-terminal domain-containing protein n=1 Tax=Rhodococcus sp. MTM3W5.2 TaxID=1805827 RepID=UPI003983D2EF